jgi:agmatine/peptidylarginine deiminase
MLVWPHNRTDWTPWLEAVELTYVKIAREITLRQSLLIVCCNVRQRTQICDQLCHVGIDLTAVRFAVAPFNDTWIRDYGPLNVLDGKEPRLLDCRFNGWGGKYPANLDDALTRTLYNEGVFGAVPMERVSLVLEGGSIDTDGAGGLLTTSSCLLGPNRNPSLNRQALELQLCTLFGIKRVLWLEHGWLAGDDTDSHIDMLARFCTANTLAYTACEDPSDEQYEPLKAMKAQLESFRTRAGKPYRLIPLPVPAPIHNNKGHRLPASYSNYVIINGAVLVPTYRDPADEVACQRLQRAFPGRDVVGVDCKPLIQQYGSLHCITMHLPEGVSIADASRFSPTLQQ